MTTRSIAFLFGAAATDIPDERLKVHPDVEVYRIDGPDPEHQIDMGLLSDLVCPVALAFIGGEDAKRFAEMYHGTWIEDGPSAEEDLMRFWGLNNG